ncbi:MAG: TonB family protein [Campylobacter sp.]|nr:TonB family protein [Campylobacter sp.]
MAYAKNTYGNVIAFLISVAVHSVIVYFVFTTLTNDIFFAQKQETKEAMAINLNQISLNNNSNSDMQASEMQSIEANAAEQTQEIKKEEPKEEPKEEVKEPEPKPIEKPKKVVPIEKPKPKKPKETKEVKAQETLTQETIKEPTSETPTPASAPSSQNLADNEAVSQGGSKQSGVSSSLNQANARTILGEIQDAIFKHKTYPKRAIDGKMQGKIGVRFLLKSNCEFEILELTKSSGFDFLDNHALKIVKKACGDFPSEAVGMDIKVPIAFNLKHIDQ